MSKRTKPVKVCGKSKYLQKTHKFFFYDLYVTFGECFSIKTTKYIQF